ncbi:MAG: hypothetical protein GVY17_01705 [Cyanobacteria bacterium]|jgi:hypothetical protein|nr:hypothetical protein [Cyanobacteria bacterium GSL.Bin21]
MNSSQEQGDNYLSQMIGYSALPDEEEELLLEEEGSGETDASDVSRNALIRSLVIFAGVGIFTGALLLILSLFQNTNQQTANNDQGSPPQEEEGREQSDEELQQLKEENSRLRAERALSKQAKQQQQETTAETSPSEPPEPKDLEPVPKAESNPNPKPQLEPLPRAVQPAPQPRVVRVQSPSKVKPETDPVDPEKRWDLLAQSGQDQGSGYYGSPRDINGLGVSSPSNPGQNVMQFQKVDSVQNNLTPTTSINPFNPQAPSTTANGDSEGVIQRFRLNLNSSTKETRNTVPGGMSKGEWGIIQSQASASESVWVAQGESLGEQGIIRRSTPPVVRDDTSVSELPIGSNAAGVVEVPMVWSPSTETPTDGRFMVRLSEPLRDLNGDIAIDAGAMLVTDISAKADANHLIRQSVVAIIYEHRGKMHQLEIPEGLLLVRGQGNLPLIAQGMNDPGGDIAKQDTLIGLISAVGRVGEVLNDPSEEIVIDDGDDLRVEQTTRNEPDLVGAALEGFFKPLVDRLESRSQQGVQELLERPNIYFVEAGTPVSVFVNGLITVEK